MASLGNILRGALGGEYSMGRDLDDEERRQIEELRAAGVYVPQESQSSPFSYGAGTVRKQNLQDMRDAMQPEQQRKMKDYMQAQGEMERNRMNMELQQRQMANQAAMQEQARKRAVDTEMQRQRLSGLPTTSPQQRFADQSDGSMMYRSEADYLADEPEAQINPRQQAELAILNRENLPSRIQEQSLSAQQQALKNQELNYQVGLVNLQDQQAASQLAARVREALPANYAQSLADKQAVSAELAALLDAQRLKTQQKFGAQLAAKSVDKQVNALDLEVATLDAALEWLQSDQGRAYQSGGMQIDAIQKLKAELELTRAQTGYYNSRALTGKPSGSPMLDALGGELSMPFNLNPGRTSGTID